MAALPLLVGAAEPRFAPAICLREERPADAPAREALLDAAMGPGRTRKSSEAIRRGRLPAEGLSLVAVDPHDRVVGTVRLWHIVAGRVEGEDVPALLLGPLAVRPDLAGCGIGAALTRRAIAAARMRGHRAIILVGDAPYYGRFGFSADPAAWLDMPGPFERHRLLALELAAGALAGAAGLVRSAGQAIPAPGLAPRAPAKWGAV